MKEDGKERVVRLVAWIKRFHRDLLNAPDGEVSPAKLAAATGKSQSHWSDVLRYQKPSFAAAAARETEELLGIPRLHLEGAGWPFEDVDQRRFDRLGRLQKGRVEQVLIEALDRLENEQSRKRPLTSE